MLFLRRLGSVCLFALLTGSVAFAYPHQPQAGAVPGLFNPFLRLFVFPLFSYLTIEQYNPPAPVSPPCIVPPLAAIEDSEALAMEDGSDSFINLDGLTPFTAKALSRFELAVTSLGGVFELKSAHRPQAYQDHLREVWEKWMYELRNNTDENCQSLRAEVGAEFARHRLMESQRPAASSDHTRGTAFDAAVILPRRARIGKRRVTVDKLARRYGISRPVAWSDPVHFRAFR